MVDFQGVHFNTNKALYINFQKHASIFCMEMLSTNNGGGHRRCYLLLTSMCTTKKNDLPIEDRYSGLIFQHALSNIINVSQMFIKLLHQKTKPNGLVVQLTNGQNGNK